MTKKNPNKIFLVGFMASGKTTLAKKLSKHLNYSFIDTDKLIEEEQNKSITQIFNEDGEDFFRDLEKNTLLKLTDSNTKMVISTGGGMACNKENIKLMLANGKVVFLELDIKSILNRIKNGKNKRPLLQQLSDTEIEHKIKKLYKNRISFYKQAHITINAFNIRSYKLNELMSKINL